MSDALRLIAQRVDADALELTRDDLLRWHRRLARSALRAGLVRRAGSGTFVACDECGDAHVEEVLLVEEPAGSESRAFILCPEAGRRVRVPLKRLRLYRVDLAALARGLAIALSIRSDPAETLPGRLWRLGLMSLRGTSHAVHLARLSDDVLEDPSVRTQDIVLCAGTLGRERLARDDIGVAAVADVAVIADGRLEIDSALLPDVPGPGALADGNVFVRDRGARTWTVAFGGVRCSVRDSLGMLYIAELLRAPRRPVPCCTLREAGARQRRDRRGTAVKLGRSHAAASEDDALADGAAEEDPAHAAGLAGIATKLKNLAARREKATRNNDRAELDRIDIEREEIAREYAASAGRPGRRRETLEEKKARQSVTGAIKRALADIEAAHKPLWLWLDPLILPGGSCVYASDVAWQTSA